MPCPRCSCSGQSSCAANIPHCLFECGSTVLFSGLMRLALLRHKCKEFIVRYQFGFWYGSYVTLSMLVHMMTSSTSLPVPYLFSACLVYALWLPVNDVVVWISLLELVRDVYVGYVLFPASALLSIGSVGVSQPLFPSPVSTVTDLLLTWSCAFCSTCSRLHVWMVVSLC
jgi:hypothetical protein